MATITITLPKRALEELRRRAEAEGKALEELVGETLLAQLHMDDPMARAELHWELCEKYLREARALLEEGDYIQASEKAWAAASQAVKAVAAGRGLELRSHRDLHGFIMRLREETGDEELRRLWHAANELHRNFYEAWLPPEMVIEAVGDAERLVEKLRALAGGTPRGNA